MGWLPRNRLRMSTIPRLRTFEKWTFSQEHLCAYAGCKERGCWIGGCGRLQSSLAITKAFAQLLAFHGKILKVGWLETFVRRFALDHYAIGLLETLRQCEAWVREDLVRNLLVDGQKEEGRQLGSSIGF